MGTWEYELITGDENWTKPYWLDHAIGFVIIEDGRNYALERLDPSLSDGAQTAAVAAANHAIAGLMGAVDGVTVLENDEYYLEVTVVGTLKRAKDHSVVARLDLRDSDGAGMGFGGWSTGYFGDVPIAEPQGHLTSTAVFTGPGASVSIVTAPLLSRCATIG